MSRIREFSQISANKDWYDYTEGSKTNKGVDGLAPAGPRNTNVMFGNPQGTARGSRSPHPERDNVFMYPIEDDGQNFVNLATADRDLVALNYMFK